MAEISKRPLNISAGSLFPWHFQMLAILMLVGSIAAAITSWPLSLVLLIVAATMLTAKAGFQIDAGRKLYREYNSFLFIKSGSWESYHGVEVIFVNSSKVSKQMYSRYANQSSTFSDLEYNGFLKFSSGDKAHILTLKSKDKLMKSLEDLSRYLNADIVDYTTT